MRFASYCYNYTFGIFSIYKVKSGAKIVTFSLLSVAVYLGVEVVNGNGHLHVPVALPQVRVRYFRTVWIGG